MSEKITRRAFLQRAALGMFAVTLDPAGVFRWINRIELPRFWHGVTSGGEPTEQEGLPIADADIPTRFFYPGYTQKQLDQAWARGDLRNGFSYGLVDTQTLGGIPVQQNVTIDDDGSARLTLRRATDLEWATWNADPNIRDLILTAEKNKLEMRLAAAVFCGRLPTDLQSFEASITLPQRVISGDPRVGMTGTAWAVWTQPDMERLTAMLRVANASEDEIRDIGKRIGSHFFEEDLLEFSLGEPTAELGYPLWARWLGGQFITFLAGRKTATQNFPRVDLMHALFEPMDVAIPPLFFWHHQTLRGWLAQQGKDTTRILTQPLRGKLEIGSEVYDATRDAMVVPMTFRLNDYVLNPTAIADFPGLENDPTGSLPANLSIWKIRTRAGIWIPVPRQFIVSFCSSARHNVKGTSDYVRVSNIIITRKNAPAIPLSS